MQPELPPLRWWPIDPTTGVPLDIPLSADSLSQNYLGDEALDAAGTVADNIEATFGASRHFSEDERRRLIHERQLPASVRPHADAAAELIECVDDLWKWVEQVYRDRWARPPLPAERKLITDFAIWVLRGSDENGSSPVHRPSE
jgi:hypothetical protein